MENKKIEVFPTGTMQPEVRLLSISNLIFCVGFLWHAHHRIATLKHSDLQGIYFSKRIKEEFDSDLIQKIVKCRFNQEVKVWLVSMTQY